jgi:hypothetical protein
MPRRDLERVGLLLVLALSVASCSDDGKSPHVAADSGWPGDWPDEDAGHGAVGDAGGDAGRPGDIDAEVDAAAAVVDGGVALARTACLDRPGALPAPPTGPLPCELLAPGTTLPP